MLISGFCHMRIQCWRTCGALPKLVITYINPKFWGPIHTCSGILYCQSKNIFCVPFIQHCHSWAWMACTATKHKSIHFNRIKREVLFEWAPKVNVSKLPIKWTVVTGLNASKVLYRVLVAGNRVALPYCKWKQQTSKMFTSAFFFSFNHLPVPHSWVHKISTLRDQTDRWISGTTLWGHRPPYTWDTVVVWGRL